MGLIDYIDETYAQYSSEKFVNNKSWYVYIKSATALIQDVGIPRHGVMNSFQVDVAQSINQIIFYATLRSLERMALILIKITEIPQQYLQNLWFLSMNTSVEAVDKLVD